MGLVQFIADLFSRSKRRSFRSPDESGGSDLNWLGREGERLAARHLKRTGYRVLYRNFRAPHGGEVDLVCRDRDTLVFAEVKTRRSLAFGSPAEAVTREKQKFIARGALAWLELLGNPEDILFRFDIVEIVFEDDTPTFHVIKDAFKLPEPYIY
jgi:putative endonuclease